MNADKQQRGAVVGVVGQGVVQTPDARVHGGPRLAAILGLMLGGCENGPGEFDPQAGGTGAPTDGLGEDASSGSDDGNDASDQGTTSMRPNWHEDIAPLVAHNCRPCHNPEGPAFAMSDYEATQPWAVLMESQTQTRVMPPWHAIETDECEPTNSFADDARLDEAEIQLFADWAAAGAPEGDPAAAAPVPTPASIDLADPTTTVAMRASVTIEQQGDKLDFFHCLSLDPGNTQDVYVDALQLIPGNNKIVHHVVMYVDEGAESASWPNGLLENCDGGPGVSGTTMIGGWVPGSKPIVTPDDVGIRLPAGARIVLNMHYNSEPSGPQTDDATALALRWSTQTPPWISEFRLIGNPGSGSSSSGEFLIPAGAVGHQEALEWQVPDAVESIRVWAVLHHMHKVGVDMKTEVSRAAGDECLVQTPQYDYQWQRAFAFDTPIEAAPELRPGDTVRVRCTYDNVLENPGVAEALAELGLDAPRDVANGEGTLDEMCTAGIAMAVRAP